MDNVFQRGQWMNDSESDSCLECNSSFSLLLRRHHCRRCGGLFCDNCTSKRMLIPDALFVVPPNSLFHESDSTVINRCCGSCTILLANYRSPQSLIAALPTTVPFSNLCESNGSLHASKFSTSLSINQNCTTASIGSNSAVYSLHISATQTVLREIDCVEWRGGSVGTGRFKMYSITVPSSISKSRRFQVSLDSRVMTVVLPLDIVPGQRILLKAPSPSVCVQKANAVTVLAPSKKEGLLSCPSCSYDNPMALLNCLICRSPVSFDPLSSPLPTATALELCDDDVPRRYVTKVPAGVRPDDVFEVVLDLRLFSVICPLDAEGGDNIVVLAPDPVLREGEEKKGGGGVAFDSSMLSHQKPFRVNTAPSVVLIHPCAASSMDNAASAAPFDSQSQVLLQNYICADTGGGAGTGASGGTGGSASGGASAVNEVQSELDSSQEKRHVESVSVTDLSESAAGTGTGICTGTGTGASDSTVAQSSARNAGQSEGAAARLAEPSACEEPEVRDILDICCTPSPPSGYLNSSKPDPDPDPSAVHCSLKGDTGDNIDNDIYVSVSAPLKHHSCTAGAEGDAMISARCQSDLQYPESCAPKSDAKTAPSESDPPAGTSASASVADLILDRSCNANVNLKSTCETKASATLDLDQLAHNRDGKGNCDSDAKQQTLFGHDRFKHLPLKVCSGKHEENAMDRMTRNMVKKCPLCTYENREHDVSTNASFCCVCMQDLRGAVHTPVAVPIPLATPCLTVISSLSDVEVPFPLPLVLLSRPLHSDSSLGHGEGLALDAPSLDWTFDRTVRNDIATAIATPYNQASSSSSSLPSSPSSSCTEAPVHAEHSVNISPSQDTYLAHLDAAVTMMSSTSVRDCIASRINGHSHTDMEIDMDYTEREGEMKREMEEEQGDIAISIAIAEQWTACIHCTTDNPPNAARCEVCFGALSDAGRGL